MLRLADAEIMIPCLQCVILKDAQMCKDLLGPQQASGGAGGNQVAICHGYGAFRLFSGAFYDKLYTQK